MLQDAYPWNVVFRGSTPVFVDLTSVVPVDPHLIWPASLQFKSFFLRPLEACRQGRGQLARARLYDNIDGIDLEDFCQITSAGYKLAHPWLMLERWLERRMGSNPALMRKLRSAASSTRVTVGAEVRRVFFKRLLARMQRFRFAGRDDPWSDYYSGIDPSCDKGAKLRIVQRLLDRFRPKTVLDLGCNTGVFSLVAASRGARVVSLDASEACIEALHAQAAAANMSVTPLIADVLCPTPAFGFLGAEYPSLVERVRADVVLCLALMHHLHITGRQSFERITALMDRVTAKHLIFEFVASDDANNSLLSLSRPIDYSLQTVVEALRRHFPVTETLDSDRPTRRIIVCSR
jgi:SAM-dependent methyltransferase